jgi:hypothetical protein
MMNRAMSTAENARHVKQMILRETPLASVVLRSMIGVYHTFDLIEREDFAALVFGYIFNMALVLHE